MILGCHELGCDSLGFKILWSWVAWGLDQMTLEYLGAWTWWHNAHHRTCSRYQTCLETPSHENTLRPTPSLSQNS
jgi:hypothetical protein